MIIYDKEGTQVEIEHSIDVKAAVATGKYTEEAPSKKVGRPRAVKIPIETPVAKPVEKKIENPIEKPEVKPIVKSPAKPVVKSPAKKLLQRRKPIKQ
jgi:hypothetical protein